MSSVSEIYPLVRAFYFDFQKETPVRTAKQNLTDLDLLVWHELKVTFQQKAKRDIVLARLANFPKDSEDQSDLVFFTDDTRLCHLRFIDNVVSTLKPAPGVIDAMAKCWPPELTTAPAVDFFIEQGLPDLADVVLAALTQPKRPLFPFGPGSSIDFIP